MTSLALLLLLVVHLFHFSAGDYVIEELRDENATTSPPFSISRVVPFDGGLRLFLRTDSPEAVAALSLPELFEAQLSDHESETARPVALSLGKAIWCSEDGNPVFLAYRADPLRVWREATRKDRVLLRGGRHPRSGSRSRYRPGPGLLVAYRGAPGRLKSSHPDKEDKMQHEVMKGTITSWEYITDNFEPGDRLAVVIKRQQKHALIQRLATAEQLAGPRFQAWLRFENARGGNVYVSMNPLKPDARGRTKPDIAMVRHLYLDLDHDGSNALAAILDDPRLPGPSYVLNTSPGKHQVVWKVSGFTPEQAERLQRAMATAHGADRAATDVTRVLRIPGLRNRKYDPPLRGDRAEALRGDSRSVGFSDRTAGRVRFPSQRTRFSPRARRRPGPRSASPNGTGPRPFTGFIMEKIQPQSRPGWS